MNTANPNQVVLAGVRQLETTCLSFHRNANGLGELKRQPTLGREGGYVLFVLCIRFALRLGTVFGIIFALVFRIAPPSWFPTRRIFRAVPPKRELPSILCS